MKIILLGAPGSGKGTHAVKLSSQFQIPHISTGEIFRKNLKEETELGLQVKDILAHGYLVPDQLTVAIVDARLHEDDCKNGYILDGFPRSMAQAVAFDELDDVDFALLLVVDAGEIFTRLVGRMREDDNPAIIANRLDVYEKTTSPLIEYYQNQNKLKIVDGNGTIDEVYQKILQAIET